MPKLDIKKLKPKGISLKGIKLKRKPSKKAIIFSIIFVIIVAAIIAKIIMPKPAPQVKYTTLSKGKVVNSVNVLGEIKSQDTTNIYSTESNAIKEVKVGDNVKTGDILAILDSAGLEKDIEQSTATADATDANNKVTLEAAQKAYDDELKIYNNNLNTDVKNAEEVLNLAKINLDDKKKTYEKNKSLYDAQAITESDFNKVKIDYDTANSDYEKAKVSLENVKIKADQALSKAKNEYDTAQNNYNNKSQRIAIEKQKQQLENCTIKATVDGTVTSVNATVGNSGSGILFELENLDNIEITVPIKEVDIANIKVGQRAEIKTDSTGNDVIEGEVVSVSPSAKKDIIAQSKAASQSQQGTSSDAGFEAKVKVNNANQNMKVGMSARVNIITSEKSDVYTVSSESIIENGNGKSVYVAEKVGEKGNEYIVKELPISTGLESDFNVEISGEGISDGIFVINDPSTCKVGEKIQIKGA
ncbi:efflux RND transporter periplasmic adaptor subunit [Clostridium saccharoperbutylacetonicum]|uniref:Multidrug resistance efflux pump n=1 Tax=Clostridium saccharoperbutylacetonicum N1-4(HMT) TaxID=931276 RepID=M1MCF9_9CLOT|nr:HlyD family efflux transporter periplasmic adaptor subunit [Clostridium saccharoperbutylacetonicum]AGF54108.1 multidrug resistance efflux pump [Clostridium saccharoperbutylacetonicum N1-4(HMT)]NRT59379.1 multidrug resistance efflux pump [Clostridium saccharoperbutylacetonicum]